MERDATMAIIERVETGLRIAIGSVGVAGVRRRNPGAVVNAVVALAATYLPALLDRQSAVELRPWQRLYVTAAMLAHAVGMLGPYDDVWWWDHLTHALSASIVGSVIHVLARRRDRDPVPHVVVGVLALGTLWELVEYAIHRGSRRLGLEPVLVSYGRVDTALDLVCNLLGAVVVVAFADPFLENLTRRDESDTDPSDGS